MRRLYCLAVILLVAAAVGFSQTSLNYGTYKPTKQITISIETDLSGPPSKPPTEDVVTPVLRQKTGVTAIPYPCPSNLGTTAGQRVQAQIAANNLPDLYTESYTPPQVDGQQALIDMDMAWDFHDKAFIKKMFPNFTRRLDVYGSFEDWYANEQTYNGTHIRITSNVPTLALTKLMNQQKGTTFYRRNGWLPGQYPKALRDDILKMIYPNARTDAQQEQFWITKHVAASPVGANDPWADVPITSMDSLYNYMKKVKEIIDSKGLTDITGRDKMIPAQLNFSNGNAPSIMWSNITMYGYIWTEPPFHVGDRAYYNFQEPWVKDVLKWWNKCYNDGLLDPEVFVKKDDQLAEEIVRGRFAIFPMWGANVDDARRFAKENGQKFGYRVIPCWWPRTFKNTYNDASNQWTTYFQHFAANIITKNVKEEDLAQVCNWLDYHYSEEFDILRSWGPATFYTGTGKDRRFRPAYKDLENFQAYGISNPKGKDGYYYGVTQWAPVALTSGTTSPEITCAFLTVYPYAPQYVYPEKRQVGMAYDQTMLNDVMAYYVARNVNFFPQIGWTNAELNNLPNFAKIQYAWFGTHVNAIAKAIVGTPAEFEANYAAYQKVFRDNDWDLGMSEYQLKWKEIFDTYVKKYWKF